MRVMAFGGDHATPKEWHTEFVFFCQSTLVEQHSPFVGFMEELQIMQSDFALWVCGPEAITASKQEKIFFILFRFNISVL